MMEIKSLFSVFIKRAVSMRKIGKMGRPPKILEETTGRLTEKTNDKLSKRKNLSLHQRKEILQLIKKPENNYDVPLEGHLLAKNFVDPPVDLPETDDPQDIYREYTEDPPAGSSQQEEASQ